MPGANTPGIAGVIAEPAATEGTTLRARFSTEYAIRTTTRRGNRNPS